MIVARISDGFGNQLFMYACAYTVAKNINDNLYLDTTILDTNNSRELEIDKLNIKYKKLVTFKWLKIKPMIVGARYIYSSMLKKSLYEFKDEKPTVYDKDIEKVEKNTYLNGYWQSYKYFNDYRDDILKMFTPKYKHNEEYFRWEQQINNSNSVAVHVRRGDYVDVGCTINNIYYNLAIETIEKKEKELTYFVFSDDIEYAKELFKRVKNNIIYVNVKSENSALEEFFLMSKCKHQIIANSTFSWWAGWLNNNTDKVVISPELGMWCGDFYPENWIKIKL